MSLRKKPENETGGTVVEEQTYYQVVLVDHDKGTFRPANGNGETSAQYLNYEDALKDLWSWGLMYNGS